MSGWACTLPFPPSDNDCWAPRAIFSPKLKRWVGIIYETKEAKTYKEQLAKHFLVQRPRFFEGDVDVTLRVFRPNKRRDAHNAIAVLVDALQGHVYKNDRQIRRLLSERCDDEANPRVEVEVYPLNETLEGIA
jgi:Holliday junction resolvase RusA-like endonuclease